MFPCRYGRRNFMNHRARPCGWGVVGLLCVPCGPGVLWGLGFVWWMRVSHAVSPCVVGWVVVFGVVVCGASPRPISTGRLGIAAVHLRPINPMFCGGPYPIAGWETLS